MDQNSSVTYFTPINPLTGLDINIWNHCYFLNLTTKQPSKEGQYFAFKKTNINDHLIADWLIAVL